MNVFSLNYIVSVKVSIWAGTESFRFILADVLAHCDKTEVWSLCSLVGLSAELIHGRLTMRSHKNDAHTRSLVILLSRPAWLLFFITSSPSSYPAQALLPASLETQRSETRPPNMCACIFLPAVWRYISAEQLSGCGPWICEQPWACETCVVPPECFLSTLGLFIKDDKPTSAKTHKTSSELSQLGPSQLFSLCRPSSSRQPWLSMHKTPQRLLNGTRWKTVIDVKISSRPGPFPLFLCLHFNLKDLR